MVMEKGTIKIKKISLIDTDNSVVITSRQGGVGRLKRAKGVCGDGRRLDLGW